MHVGEIQVSAENMVHARTVMDMVQNIVLQKEGNWGGGYMSINDRDACFFCWLLKCLLYRINNISMDTFTDQIPQNYDAAELMQEVSRSCDESQNK